VSPSYPSNQRRNQEHISVIINVLFSMNMHYSLISSAHGYKFFRSIFVLLSFTTGQFCMFVLCPDTHYFRVLIPRSVAAIIPGFTYL